MKKFSTLNLKEFLSQPLFSEEVILKKDESWPRLSIITPSYNQGQFLERTILSVLNQNYPNLEYIIIDGGSKDNSLDIIKKYEKYLSFWVSEEDKGQTDAINKGFKMATGEFLAWQNSDDIYLPQVLRRVGKIIQENPNIDVVFGNMLFIDAFDNVIDELRFVPFSYNRLVYEGTVIVNQAAFIKREKLKEIGFLREKFRFCMDYDLWLRLFEKNKKVLFVKEFFGGFRLHEESKTNTISHVGNEEHDEILREKSYKPDSWTFFLLKYFYKAMRVFQYFLQGDGDYVFCALKRFLDLKLKNKM